MSAVGKIRRLKTALKDFLIGATLYDMIKDLQDKRLITEYTLMSVVLGDLLGYPVSSYYKLKMLPFWLPRLRTWKHRMLKEKDVTDKLK